MTERIRHEARRTHDARCVAELSRRLISAQWDERKALALELKILTPRAPSIPPRACRHPSPRHRPGDGMSA